MYEMTDEQWLAQLRENLQSRLMVYTETDRLLSILDKREQQLAALRDAMTAKQQRHAAEYASLREGVLDELTELRTIRAAAKEYRDAENRVFRAMGAEQRDELRGDLNRAQETLDKLLKAGDET